MRTSPAARQAILGRVLTDTITAIEHSGRQNTVTSARELTELWKVRIREAVKTKFLPDGMLHFDFLFKVV